MFRFPLTFLVPKQTKHIPLSLSVSTASFYCGLSSFMWWWGETGYELVHLYAKEKSRVNDITNKQVEVREHWVDISKDTSQCFYTISLVIDSCVMYCKILCPYSYMYMVIRIYMVLIFVRVDSIIQFFLLWRCHNLKTNISSVSILRFLHIN